MLHNAIVRAWNGGGRCCCRVNIKGEKTLLRDAIVVQVAVVLCYVKVAEVVMWPSSLKVNKQNT